MTTFGKGVNVLRIAASAFSLLLALGFITFAGIIASGLSSGDSADSVYITLSAMLLVVAIPLAILPLFLWTRAVRWRIISLLAAIAALVAFAFPYAFFIGGIGYFVNLCALILIAALATVYALKPGESR